MRFRVEKMGEAVEGVRILGDPNKPEPEEFRIEFPWGHVSVVRAQEKAQPDYWVHVYVNNQRYPYYDRVCDGMPGMITDARLDQTDKHSAETNLGDFERPELFHLAVKIGPQSETREQVTPV